MNKKIKVMTRLENEDNLKVSKLIDTYTKSGTIIENVSDGDGKIEIAFTIKTSLIKKFIHDLKVLNFVGIKGEIES